jgi:hypothetical protein
MAPKNWGPPIWALFHTMAEKVKDENFAEIGPQMFNLIRQICRSLPCPDCANHATTFLNKVNVKTIQTKINFKMMLFAFHNMVNKRKELPWFNSEDLSKYALNKLPQIFIIFSQSYNKKTGNMKLMADSMVRRSIIQSTSEWFKKNYMFFNE